MGSPSVVFIITIFMLVSLQSTHILIAGGSREVQKPYFKEESGVGVANEKKNQVEKVSGKDDNEDSETLLLQKLRALLGLRSSKTSSLTKNLSPSPSPSPSTQPEPPALSPSPMPPVHKHSHFPLHHPKPKSPLSDKAADQHTDNGRHRKVLMAVVFALGVALLVCLLGLIWVMRGKIQKHKKAPFKTMSVHRKKGRSRGKVSLNPGLDFLYLDALGRDLEQQTISLKQTSQTLNTIYEREDSNQELIIKPEICDNNTSSGSSTREIISVHVEVELDFVNGESVGGNSSNGDKIIPIEDHSSDDESFHSFVDDPHSSSTRHSNASAASLSKASENSPPKILPSPSFNRTQSPKLEVPSPSDSSKTSTPPPPPPPPPPIAAPSTHFLTFKTSFKPTKTLSKAPGSSTLLNLPKWEFSPSPKISPKISGALPPSVPPPPLAPPLPFMKGNSTGSSIKGQPPPPPSQFTPPVGKDGAPLPKLKPLHWDKVRAAPDRSMVWDKIRSSSFELDEEMIESLFGYNLQSPIKNEESKSKSASASKHVLDPKRLQNITILSKAINSTAEQVCDALIRGDGLSQQQLEALAKMVPTKEEEGKLSCYKGNKNELGSAEKFVKVVLSVPFSFLRVEAMLYRETFDDEVVHLRNSFSMLEEACKELRSSRLFLKLLEAVLKTGNRMNVGTIRGGAKAFKLDTLLKLADVKGTDGKTTLLHFVVQEIIRSEGLRVSDSIMGKINQTNNNNRKSPEEKEEDCKRMGLDLVSGLSTELYNVKKTATLDLELLASSVSNLSDGMTKLKELVNELVNSDQEKNGRFVGSMKAFIGNAERALKELGEDEERVLIRVREVTEYFHGVNVSKDDANPLRIFVIVRDFLGMLDHVCKELRSLKVSSSPNPLAPFR